MELLAPAILVNIYNVSDRLADERVDWGHLRNGVFIPFSQSKGENGFLHPSIPLRALKRSRARFPDIGVVWWAVWSK